MQITNLFFYKLLFAVEIAAAEFLFMLHLKKRRFFALRLGGCMAVFLAISAFFPVFINNAIYLSAMFLILFAATLPMLKFCYDEPWRNIFFCAMASYTMQHFAYELANLALSLIVWGKSPILGLYDNSVIDLFSFDKIGLFYMLVYALCITTAYWGLYSAFGRRIKKGQDVKIKSYSYLFLVWTGLLADIVLNSVLIYLEIDFAPAMITYVMNLLCCVLLLYCQFSLLATKELQHELEFVHKLWHQEKEQYLISKENIEIINLKCHDMRHQIREIGKNKSIEPETIKEIESSISLYDSMVKTGNEVLDIILTEKSLRCLKNGITLTCVADGALLSFMQSADLYSLFGNALDNAIEAVLKIEKRQERIIGLKIHGVGEMVTVNVNNSFTGKIDCDENGFPLTTKDDKNYHGYGLKSISYVVDKYGGDLSIVVKDGLFNLNILLPAP